MKRIEVRFPVPPERVFQMLEDPTSLRLLVPGARHIRRFDPRWPQPGSEVQHSVGFYPFVVRDRTSVVECVQDEKLVLEARVRMLGVFAVDFQLEPDGAGTRLVIDERLVGGFLSLPVLRQLAEVTLAIRNAELGRRLKKLIEKREPFVEEVTGD